MAQYSSVIFDLDDTLYPASSGLWSAICCRIELYMHEHVKIPSDKILDIRRRLYTEYGTTMRGLISEFSIDPEEYLAFVHDVPLENYISEDNKLRETLENIPLPKYIFTNADADHAGRVLLALGLSDCFKGIIDIRKISPYCKPQKEAFLIALEMVDNSLANECIFIDDNTNNLDTAFNMGFYTIGVGTQLKNKKYQAQVKNILDIGKIMDEILRN